MNIRQTGLPNIAFIGAGNMASSLIGGLIAKGFPAKNITVSDPHELTLQQLASRYAVRKFADNTDAIADANVIVLAVKPQVMRVVAENISTALAKQNSIEAGPLFISIAAGISLASLQHWIGRSAAIVRCMPNTPALIQLGATGLFANEHVSLEQKQQATHILDAVGVSIWLNREEELDAVTALSGSGPAYYFLLMEAMIKAGIAQGLDSETAKRLTLQTALGAATMAAKGDDDPAELRRKVTSPNGTTEQAILSFQKNNFEQIVKLALDAANQRSRSLSVELGKSGE